MTGDDFSDQNLANATLSLNLTGANFEGSNLSGAQLQGSNIIGADFRGAVLSNVALHADLTNVNFNSANLANVYLSRSNFTNADLTNAIITGADLSQATGLTFAQIQTTASYKNQFLIGINFSAMDLSNWNLSGQNLTNATLSSANLTNANLSSAILSNAALGSANLSGANLTNADFTNSYLHAANLTNAIITGANLSNARVFMSDIQTTWNYQNKNLSGIRFDGEYLGTLNLNGQNLSHGSFIGAILPTTALANTDFSFADLRDAANWLPVSTTITHDTILPDGSIAGLTLAAGQILTIRSNSGPLGIPPVNVNNFATFSLGATLAIEFNASGPSILLFSDNFIPSLGGTLQLNLAPGTDPATMVGKSYHFTVWRSTLPAGDQFASITSNLPAGYQWDTSQFYTEGTVTLNAAPEPETLLLAGVSAGGFLMRRRRSTQ